MPRKSNIPLAPISDLPPLPTNKPIAPPVPVDALNMPPPPEVKQQILHGNMIAPPPVTTISERVQ